MSIKPIRRLFTSAIVCGLLLVAFPGSPPKASESADMGVLLLTDFSTDSPDLGWYVQNDNVMGGRSEGGFERAADELVFTGNTNTNGGGFSSIRTQPFSLDLSAYSGIELRLKADGRQYTWQLQTNARWRGSRVSYWAEFDTPKGEWVTIRIPFADFYPQFRGFRLDGPELDTAEVSELGLYIYDKKDGVFKLQLDSISAYKK